MLMVPDGASLPELAPTILLLLLDLVLKGMVLLALAGLVTFLFRQASAALRHLVWSLALGSLLLLPVFSLALPTWHVTALTEIPYLHTVTEVLETTPALQERVARVGEAMPQPASGETQAAPAKTEDVNASVPSAAPDPAYEAVLQAFSSLVQHIKTLHWTAWLTLAWLLGVMAILGRFLLGALGVYWFAFRARPLGDPAWHAQAQDVREQLGLRRRVRLLRSTRTAMPMTWGVLRPVVLLPVHADTWTPGRRHCVLLHEFAHIQRLDCLTQTLAQLVCAIHWFNPLVWVAARQMREEREKACDDWVLEGGVRPSQYAAHLLDIARSTRSTLVVPLGTLSMARPSQLEGRVVAILDKARSRRTLSRFGTGVSVLLASLLVLPLAALRPGEAPPPSEEAPVAVTPPGWKSALKKNTYRWTGAVEEGQTLTLRGGLGDIQTTLTAGQTVEVVALLDDETPMSWLGMTTTEDGIILCIQRDAATCEADAAPSPQTPVTFVARVPAGVHVDARTNQGAIKAVGLRGDVAAATTAGDIFIQTTGRARAQAEQGNIELRTAVFGSASTERGNILARIGQTTWKGTLPLHAQNGDIAVELPAAADTDIDLRVESEGRLQATIPLEQKKEHGEQFRGRLGRGGRMLALHTSTGNITITHLGSSDVEVAQAFDIRLESEPADEAEGAYRFAGLDINDRRRLVSRLVREDDANTLAVMLRQDPSPRVRTRAAHALGVVRCSDGLPALLAGLNDEDATVRRAAVLALTQYDDPKVEKALAQHLKQEQHEEVRGAVAEALRAKTEPSRSSYASASRTARAAVHDQPIIIDLNKLEKNVRVIDENVAAELTRVVRRWANSLDLSLDTDLDLGSRGWERLLRDVTSRSRYMQGLKQVGYKDVAPEEALLARLVGVDARYVREVQQAGLCGTLEEMVQLKLADVSSDFIKALKADGRAELSVSEVLSLRRASAHEGYSKRARSEQAPVSTDDEHEGLGFELR